MGVSHTIRSFALWNYGQRFALNARGFNLPADKGLKQIANQFRDLEYLDIERTGVTAEGLRDVMHQFPSLKHLVVEKFKGEVLYEFKRQHRDCVISPISYVQGGVIRKPQIELPEVDEK